MMFNLLYEIKRRHIITCKIIVLNEEHDINSTIDCNEDVFVLYATEERGIELPYSFHGGVASTCTGKATEGQMYQSE